jgi:transcriptional regulator with XRE-family HTH domain
MGRARNEEVAGVGARQTMERRQLGLALKRYRTLRNRSQFEVGKSVGQSDSRISKVEDGVATLSQEQLEKALEFLEVPGPERQTLLELGLRARKRQRRGGKETQCYTDTLPGSFQRIADLEADAEAIYCYEPSVIPGPIQSPGYIRAVIQSCDGIFWTPSETEVENRVAFRRERQVKTLEAARPKRLEFVFTEDALTSGDDTDVVREQLEYLLHLHREYPNITLQAMPEVGVRNPVPNGGITVLDFDGSAPRVAFTPSIYGPSTYFDDEHDTATLLRAFRRTQELSRDYPATIDLIRQKLEEN